MMTKSERFAIQIVIDRVNDLASLENACFDINSETDANVKEKIRPYMTWFESAMTALENLINADDAYEKQAALDYIDRYIC